MMSTINFEMFVAIILIALESCVNKRNLVQNKFVLFLVQKSCLLFAFTSNIYSDIGREKALILRHHIREVLRRISIIEVFYFRIHFLLFWSLLR